ncbi:MAG: DUF1552 domain-containing protein [Myxococcales bacterium]|nr:DUF1552 domain-containing protein [Myxococcales bacterium]
MRSPDLARRRFVKALGLGAGAQVLAPLAGLLHATASGNPLPRTKKVVFISMGAGLPDTQLGVPTRRSEVDWSYHEALAALAPWKNQTVIVSGLHLPIGGSQHSAGYGLLSCSQTQGGADNYGAPTAKTIDQVLGERLNPGATLPTLLFGIDRDPSRLVHSSLYASGPNQPVPYPVQSRVLFERLFPNSTQAQASARNVSRVFDRLRGDIRRLERNLAGQERQKLERYLATLEASDRRRAASTAEPERAPSGNRGAVVELPEMLDMAAQALRLGMTNVVGCAVGGGNSHWHFPLLVGPHVGTIFEAQGFLGDHGHDGDLKYQTGRTVAWKWLSEQVAVFLRALEQPLPTGGTLLDDTTVVLFSDSGPDHHNGNSYRFIVIGGASSGLRTGGRFLAFRPDTWWEAPKPDSRTVNSFMRGLAQGLGVPLPSFGQVGKARTDAPLTELL